MSRTKVDSLIELLKSGVKPVVEINNKIFDDCYLDEGMLAQLVAVNVIDKGTPDEHVQYVFNYKDFMDANREKEVANYHNPKTNHFDLTATETNYDHGDFKESSFQAMDDDEICFELSTNDLLSEYLEKKEDGQGYVAWLESLVRASRK